MHESHRVGCLNFNKFPANLPMTGNAACDEVKKVKVFINFKQIIWIRRSIWGENEKNIWALLVRDTQLQWIWVEKDFIRDCMYRWMAGLFMCLHNCNLHLFHFNIEIKNCVRLQHSWIFQIGNLCERIWCWQSLLCRNFYWETVLTAFSSSNGSWLKWKIMPYNWHISVCLSKHTRTMSSFFNSVPIWECYTYIFPRYLWALVFIFQLWIFYFEWNTKYEQIITMSWEASICLSKKMK